MTLLSDVIAGAVRELGSSQSVQSSPIGQALRTLLAPHSAQTGTPPQDTHAESDALQQLLTQFEHSGYGERLRSWIGLGPNQSIAPHEVDQAIGPEKIDALSQQTGVPRPTLLSELAQMLPAVIDSLTPQGRLPHASEDPSP